MSGLDILIPCKGFRQGKSRLAPVMSPAARALLCRRLLGRTLSLAGCFATRIAVVSSDPEVLAFAAQRDAQPITDDGAGLNAALHHANEHLLRGEDRGALLVMPIDLPLLDKATLGRFLAEAARIVIAPDMKEQGTNLLRIAPAARSGFAFRFGPESFERHLDVAASRSLAPSVFRSERAAFDLDEPGDVERLLARPHDLDRGLGTVPDATEPC